MAKLHISIRDEQARITEELDKDVDLYTDQWGAMIAAMLKVGIAGLNSTTYTAKDTGGTSRTFGGSTSQNSPLLGSVYGSTLIVRIGTGTNTPAHTDAALQTPVTPTGVPSVPTVGLSGDQIIISFSATIAPTTTPVTLKEAGIEMSLQDSGSTLRVCLLTRDTFSVLVGASGTITLAYSLTFN